MNNKLFPLIMCTALFLTACADKEPKGYLSIPTAEPIPVTQNTDTSDSDEKQVPAALLPVEETSLAINKNAPDYTPGTITDTGYESKWLGIRFTAPEGTVLSSSDAAGCEMVCQDASQGCNVMILTEDLPADFQSVDTYVTQFADEITAASTPAYKLLSHQEEVQIGANIFRTVSFSASYDGADLYQTYFMYFTNDKISSIVITYTDDSIETAGALISGFEPY